MKYAVMFFTLIGVKLKLVGFLGCLIFLAGCGHEGATVTIKNDGQNTLDSLRVVMVDGNTYQMGDLAPGEAKTVTVHVVGQSTVDVMYGERERLNTTTLIHRFSGFYNIHVTSDSTSNRVVFTDKP